MSVAVTVATNRRLLVNVVTRKELFQLTTESRRNSLPLMVSRNWLPPAVALLGESEVMDGADGQVPQDTTIASVIVSTTRTGNLALVAIGYAPRAQENGRSISLTPNEVKHASEHKNSALFIVHSVKVNGKRNPRVSGGHEIFLTRWDISQGTLEPRGYVFSLPAATFQLKASASTKS